MNNILLDVQVGQLPVRIGDITRQQFADDIASRLIIRFPSDGSTFGIGAVLPTSDEGPFFKSVTPDSINGTGQQANFELYAWSSSAGTYKRLNIAQEQLRYSVGTAAPDNTKYLLWVKVDSNGRLENILTWNRSTNAWEEVLAQLATVRGYFESFGVDGKGQIAWGNVTGKPDDIQTAINTGANGSDITAAFDYQRIWHTGINGEIIFNPSFGGWQTVDGVSGDLKFVSATTLGTTADFNSGNFTTALGRNPGWIEATDEKGRALVAADPASTWSSLSALNMTSGSQFGEAAVRLTGAESGVAEHNHAIYGLFDTGNYDQTNGFLQTGDPAIAGEVSGSKGTGRVNGDGTSLIVNEGDTDAVSAHNNVQPSIARFLLRKV